MLNEPEDKFTAVVLGFLTLMLIGYAIHRFIQGNIQ